MNSPIKCQMQHLGGACDMRQFYSPRYFVNGAHLFACGAHAEARMKMGGGYPMKPYTGRVPVTK